MRKIKPLAFTALLLAVAGCDKPAATTATGPVEKVAVDSGADASGTLRVPTNYRDTYQYL